MSSEMTNETIAHSEVTTDIGSLIKELDSTASTYEQIQSTIAEIGEERLERLAVHYEELVELFDRYEEEATGDGDFQVFIEFQQSMAEFVEGLPDDLRQRERFEEVDDVMQQRRLTEDDFDQARSIIAPIARDVDLLEERDKARDQYEELQEKAQQRLRELSERIAELEALLQLTDADLDAPVEQLHKPIQAYNERITEAFTTYKREEPARDVLDFLATTGSFPLVDFHEPPEELHNYVHNDPPGTEPIPQLLEYADYSESKLAHYVDEPATLKRVIGSNQTYLQWIDADPLTVSWPPPSQEHLQWRLRELVQVANRFASEDLIAQLRYLRKLPEKTEYERLRESAQARQQTTEEQRRRLANGEASTELDVRQAAHDRLKAKLDELSV